MIAKNTRDSRDVGGISAQRFMTLMIKLWVGDDCSNNYWTELKSNLDESHSAVYK